MLCELAAPDLMQPICPSGEPLNTDLSDFFNNNITITNFNQDRKQSISGAIEKFS